MYLPHHDQCILTIILIVAPAQGGGPESGSAVEFLGREVGGPHLQGDAFQPPFPRHFVEPPQERSYNFV